MNNIYTELSKYIRSVDAKDILFYRTKEELSYLNEWLSSENLQSKNAMHLKNAKAYEENTAEYSDSTDDDSLSDLIKKCKRCGNIEDKKSGFGNGKNGIMIILNNPSDISRVERIKLKDESRDLLKKMISAINVDIRDCYITNLIKCEPENLLNRPGLMFKNCEPILEKEIDEYNPKVVIVMGDDLPVKRTLNQKKEINWFVIDHPLSLIKKSELKKPAWKTLQTVMSALIKR